MYSFGAMLSFTVAHASIVRLRMRAGTRSCSSAPGRTSASAGVDWPLFAILGGLATGVSFARRPRPERGHALGRPRLARRSGSLFYAVYRRRVVHEPLIATVKAPPAYGPALALEYRRLLVPVVPGQASDDALDVAASLAAERGAQIAAVTVLEIPLELPLERRAARGGGAGEPRARRGPRDRRLVRRLRDPAARARPERRRRDRSRGRAPRHRDHRHRRAAEGSSAGASARSSGTPSTTC